MVCLFVNMLKYRHSKLLTQLSFSSLVFAVRTGNYHPQAPATHLNLFLLQSHIDRQPNLIHDTRSGERCIARFAAPRLHSDV